MTQDTKRIIGVQHLFVCGERVRRLQTNSLTLELSIILSICGIRKGITDIFYVGF